jgi:hypothetical protein
MLAGLAASDLHRSKTGRESCVIYEEVAWKEEKKTCLCPHAHDKETKEMTTFQRPEWI